MSYEWMDEYLCAKPGTDKDFKPEWDAHRYMLRGKMFAMLGVYKDGRPLITLKLDPEFSELLRLRYPEQVIPGYYSNKTHWSSLFLDAQEPLPDETVKQMCDNAHWLVLMGLPKALRAQILTKAR